MEQTQLQMTLEVDHETNSEEEVVGSFSVSGTMHAYSELKRRDIVRVVLHDEEGQIIGRAEGIVSGIEFKFREEDGRQVTERKHKIKV